MISSFLSEDEIDKEKRKDKLATAIHEAGHAVVAIINDTPFTGVSIEPFVTDEGIRAAGGIIGPISGSATDKAQALFGGQVAEAKFRGIKTAPLKETTSRFDTRLIGEVMKSVLAPSISEEEEITWGIVDRNYDTILKVANTLMSRPKMTRSEIVDVINKPYVGPSYTSQVIPTVNKIEKQFAPSRRASPSRRFTELSFGGVRTPDFGATGGGKMRRSRSGGMLSGFSYPNPMHIGGTFKSFESPFNSMSGGKKTATKKTKSRRRK